MLSNSCHMLSNNCHILFNDYNIVICCVSFICCSKLDNICIAIYFSDILFCLSTRVCVCLQFQGPLRDKVHCGSALVGPGTSGLPYYCTPLVCVPAVLGGLAVWRHNNKKKIIKVCFVLFISYLPICVSV